MPVTPFPRWVRCPRCHRLGELGQLDGTGQFELVHRFGRRPDLAKFVHERCQKQGQTRAANKRACVPARFLVVCEDGHLDDFPYVEYVHASKGGRCDGPQLSMSDAASTLGPQVTVRCVCGASRNIQEAAGRSGWEKLPVCRGRHPHLQQFSPCGKRLRLIVLGASNLWFGVTANALHLPQGQTAEDLIAANWHILGAQPSADVGPDDHRRHGRAAWPARGSRSTTYGRASRRSAAPAARLPRRPAGDLRDAEWQLLSRPTTERQDADFRAVPDPWPRRLRQPP